MKTSLERYKGIHPGIVLERELARRAIRQRPFALAIDELPQTLNVITKGKRRLNTALALKKDGGAGGRNSSYHQQLLLQ